MTANRKFYYETTLSDLPFTFKWASVAEVAEQKDCRPGGVAWNKVDGRVILLEFTQVMDNPDNMSAAMEAKGQQYKEAEVALERVQWCRATKHSTPIMYISTAPLIFCVRGTVMIDEARASLMSLKLTEAQLKRALSAGVRAVIAAASNMCSARAAAIRCLPKAPRGANGRRVKVTIPQKPFKPGPWRQERGWGGSG